MTATDLKADCPAEVPKKRRAIEALDPVHLAMMLAREDLTHGERKRLGQEKSRRKALVKEHRLGLLTPFEGLSPDQLRVMIEQIKTAGASAVHHGGVPRLLHNAAREVGVVHHMEPGVRYTEERFKAVIKDSDAIIAAVKESSVLPYATPGVWSAIGYARHRDLPVKIIFPDGRIERKD